MNTYVIRSILIADERDERSIIGIDFFHYALNEMSIGNLAN